MLHTGGRTSRVLAQRQSRFVCWNEPASSAYCRCGKIVTTADAFNAVVQCAMTTRQSSGRATFVALLVPLGDAAMTRARTSMLLRTAVRAVFAFGRRVCWRV